MPFWLQGGIRNFINNRLQHSCFPRNIFLWIFKSTYFEEHLQIAAEHGAAAASVLNKFRLLTVSEQWSY